MSFFYKIQAQTFSFEQALEQGLGNRFELKNAKINIQLAQQENDKLKAKWLPQINSTVDLRWNSQLQKSVLPIGQFGLPNTQLSDTRIVTFGTSFNNSLGVSAEQKIFDAQHKLDQQLNNNTVLGQQAVLDKQKIDIKLQIAEAYFLVVFNKEKLKTSAEGVARAKAYLEAGKTKQEKGTLLKNDFDRLTLDLSNAQLAHRKNEQDYELSIENLKYQMGLKTESKPTPVDDLTSLFSKFQNKDVVGGVRPELKQEEVLMSGNEINAKKQLARLLPTVSAYGNYSLLQLSSQPNPFAANTWFPFNYLGLRLNVPIFDGRQAQIGKQEFALRSQINQNNIQRLQADFDYETKSTLNAFLQAKENYEEIQKNTLLAQQILAVDKVRFEQGTLLLSDLKNSEYSLQISENNQLTAIYNLLIAQLRYKKAIGGF